MTSSAVASILRVVLRRFPLVPRPQPGCPPLPDRVRRVAELAAGTGPTGPSRIAAAHNLAALIAADCGHPDLARDLSWRHHHRYPTDRAWSDRQTRLALEPLINLARLPARVGEPDIAIALLHDLLTAHRNAGDIVIDGRHVTLRHLRPGSDDHAAAGRWLWGVVLTVGIHALTRAGRWDDAVAHARRHRGVGVRLLDGRQVAVIAAHRRGDQRLAVDLLDRTSASEPWERAVRRVLQAALLTPGTCRDRAMSDAVDAYATLPAPQENSLFTLRLGLVLHSITRTVTEPTIAARVTDRLLGLAHRGDGYHARDLLADAFAEHLPPEPRCRLENVRATGLDRTIPIDVLRTSLTCALKGSRP